MSGMTEVHCVMVTVNRRQSHIQLRVVCILLLTDIVRVSNGRDG